MKIELEIVEKKYNHGIAKQNRHLNLTKLLNNYSQFKSQISYHKNTRTTDNCSEFLSIEEINKAVVVLTDILNISAGSSGHVDLYRLLQEYLLNPDKREQMNKLI